VSGLTPHSKLFLLDRQKAQRGFVPIVPGTDAFIGAVALHRDTLYLQTNHEAPLGKLVAIKLADNAAGEFGATTVIPEGFCPLGAWTAVKNYLFVETIENVSSQLRV